MIAIAVMGLSYVTAAGGKQLRYSDNALRAAHLSEDLMEEILTKPYAEPSGGPGATRATFVGVDDYNGYSEAAGTLVDATLTAYPSAYAGLSRSVAVAAGTLAITPMGVSQQGKTVTITISDGKGSTWTLVRFIAKP
ncbi:MAG: hypothetical protein NTW19_21455 [Planctomycetota bacterium]|nr:hypothetical protein [Planctomycetota bacterium]